MLHPLSSLYYSFDPSLPKIFYFLVLFLRIMLIFSLSFAMFKDRDSFLYIDESSHNSMSITMTVLLSLLLVPLPHWILSPCRNQYFLSRSSEDQDDSDDDEEEDVEEDEDEDEDGTIGDTQLSKRAKRQEIKDRLSKLQKETSAQ